MGSASSRPEQLRHLCDAWQTSAGCVAGRQQHPGAQQQGSSHDYVHEGVEGADEVDVLHVAKTMSLEGPM